MQRWLIHKYEAALQWIQEATASFVRTRVALGSSRAKIKENLFFILYSIPTNETNLYENLSYVVKFPGTVIFLSRTLRQMRLTTS